MVKMEGGRAIKMAKRTDSIVPYLISADEFGEKKQGLDVQK